MGARHQPRSRRHHEEHENHERWLVSYADFITLLFAFFTVLYATSQQDVEKAKQFEQSIRKFFGAAVGGGDAHDGSAPESARTYIESPLRNLPAPRQGSLEVEDFVDNYLKKNLSAAEYKSLITEVGSDNEGVHIRLPARALFNSGGAILATTAIPALTKIAAMIRQTTHLVFIESHTDNSKSAPYPSNWELSALRATQLVRFLSERGGVPAAQLSTRAYADQHPLADNATDHGRNQNQRVEILISAQARED